MTQMDQPNAIIHSLQNLPGWDRFLTVWGGVSATLSFTHLSNAVGVVLSLCTIAMILPRAMLNWTEWKEKRDAEKLEREKAQMYDNEEID
jgi:ABC-type transport system involved in cytochrome bd biosynthesis fused ATPase/permease subunit